jgi:hypothetical protein
LGAFKLLESFRENFSILEIQKELLGAFKLLESFRENFRILEFQKGLFSR